MSDYTDFYVQFFTKLYRATKQEEEMHTFEIYYENADTDDPRKLLGTIQADTMGEALHKASQYWEVPSYDLVAIQVVNR